MIGSSSSDTPTLSERDPIQDIEWDRPLDLTWLLIPQRSQDGEVEAKREPNT